MQTRQHTLWVCHPLQRFPWLLPHFIILRSVDVPLALLAALFFPPLVLALVFFEARVLPRLAWGGPAAL